ncbi:hypothetical protein CONLIGDRAFT_675654 [Coniochaeta ligniaria NRRL 30616]|uniref:Uncharacterized protein n=1 Tax=Coniochaeta ligniaria NRRL 30616 TaxID=1408157 RepID=A0A1J7JMQ8_9PEZI|nr:hypothetical protein CONLIGDRAFT_675654 [Coniochaeta ligniaria NRRL 30616]
MDHQRIDDALEARPVNDRMRPTAQKLRRRNMARPKRHHRRLVQRDDDESGADSGLDSGPDSDDEGITLPQSRTISLARPSATLRVGSGLVLSSRTTTSTPQPTTLRFGGSSRTTISAAQATPLKLAPAFSTTAARPTGLGSALGVVEGDDIESGVESLSEDEDSDDETTTSAPPATTAPNSLTSTTVAATVSSAVSGAAPPPPAIGTSPPVTSTSSSLAQSTTLSTAVVVTSASNSRSSSSSSSSRPDQTAAPSPTKSVTSAPALTPTPLSTLSLPSPQLASSQTTTTSGVVGEATPGQVLGSVTSTEHKDMSQGEVAGAVIGTLAGVVVIVIAAFFLIKKLRRRGYHVPSLRLPFSRAGSGDTSPPRMTSGTTSWAAPWNRNLWGAASSSSSGTRSTVFAFTKKDPKTDSEMLDELVQATYAAEGGAGMTDEKSRRRLTDDLESQSPPSPGSFLDENFIDAKSYAKLEGPWPLRNPAKVSAGAAAAAAAPKTPGPVARWLDGILTPRQSTAAAPPPALVPGGGQMTTRWQPEPPLPVAKPQGSSWPPLEKPTPAFAKGSSRDRRMTQTTTTSSSVVW